MFSMYIKYEWVSHSNERIIGADIFFSFWAYQWPKCNEEKEKKNRNSARCWCDKQQVDSVHLVSWTSFHSYYYPISFEKQI